jgi:glycosyltransferase involved in cell wall biosynthesis
VATRLEAVGVRPNASIVWFLGTLGSTYDLDTVIEAARVLWHQSFREIQFVISGVGDNAFRLKALARDLPNIVFSGWLSQSEIAHMMSVAKIGLAAYAVGAPQGYPNKLFEYMYAGLPILSSLPGEAASLLDEENCGLFYRPGDAVQLAERVKQLMNDESLRVRLGENGLSAYRRRFAANIVYRSMAEHVLNLVNDHQGADRTRLLRRDDTNDRRL